MKEIKDNLVFQIEQRYREELEDWNKWIIEEQEYLKKKEKEED